MDFIVKGIFHCHTDLSFDCRVGLRDLCTVLEREGFGFVALTEHTKEVTTKKYEEFIADCRRVSSDKFVVIPGLEVRCSDGVEIAGIGISEVINRGTPIEVISQIRNLGGYAVWVHPLKRGPWGGRFLDCDAVEVMNGKVDGTVAPNLGLLRKITKYRRLGQCFHSIFGLDLHDLQVPRNVWIECNVNELTPSAIVESLRAGRFVSRVPNGTVPSSGKVSASVFLCMMMLRFTYLTWNVMLSFIPNTIRVSLIKWSRPIVRLVKYGQ